MTQKTRYSRRTVLTTGLATAAAGMLAGKNAAAQQPMPPNPKKPGSIRISAICGIDHRVRGGVQPIMQHIPNADFWWAHDYQPITPEIIADTDLLLTYYSGYMYTPENTEAIIDAVTNRGMGWICLHNTHWFVGDTLNEFIGAYAMLHREIQPVVLSNLNQEHPITQGIEPFIIQLDEQFGAYLANPDDPAVKVLFRGHGLHDDHWTIQGWSAERGKGRIVGLTPGHYEWTWFEQQYNEIVWRAAQWALHQPIAPFYGTMANHIW